MKISFLIFFILLILSSFSQKKDTLHALVVTSNKNEIQLDLNHLNGEQIIQLIDSLLELDSVSSFMMKSLQDYSESKKLKEDIYVSLTGFNDEGIYPSQSMYKTWDTYNLYPTAEKLDYTDQDLELILQDTVNFCNFYNPYKGLITSNYGWRFGRPHNGIDIDLEVNDPVVAAFDGMIRIARHHPGYGRVVIIRHYNGLETLYAHLHRLKVKTGDIVAAGQTIGLGGSSGQSTGSHLHFELRYRGKPLNPKSIIDFNNNVLISDSIQLVRTKSSYIATPSGISYHTVKRGESLFIIAQKYGTSINRMCTINGIRRNKPLRIGQKLMINN